MESTLEPVALRFPLPGICVAKRPPGHHPLALDLMGLAHHDGRTSDSSSLRWLLGAAEVERYHGWSRPVYAPGVGDVVAVSDGLEDRTRTGLLSTIGLWGYATFVFRQPVDESGALDIAPNVGNHVMVEVEPEKIAFYAHLQHASTQVDLGDNVHDGTVLGRVGNSGNTTAPHLHVHVLDQIHDLAAAQLVPFAFREYERWDGSTWVGESGAIPEPGQVVRGPPLGR
ncbi:MAG: M23 family metallopeptidase [Acidimicrobiales bacterium]